MTIIFDSKNREHKSIVLAAMIAADEFGVGRITAAKEQLEMQDIRAYTTRAERDAFERAIFEWGSELS